MLELATRWERLVLMKSCRGAALGVMLLTALAANAAPFAYIPNSGAATVTVIDVATNAVVTTIPVGNFPAAVAVSPDGSRVYVTGLGGISVIATATNTVLTTVPVVAIGVAVTPDGARVYAAAAGSSVAVISTATNTVLTTIPVSPNPEGVAVTPDGTRVYVTHPNDNSVTVIVTATNTVLTTVPTGLNSNPIGLAVTPDGTRVYIAESGIGGNRVRVLSTATHTSSSIPVGDAPIGVAITPDGTRAYVSNSDVNTVTVISTATNTVTGTVAVGTAPYGLAVTPDGTRVYVANEVSNNVSVISTATNTVIATPAVGIGPLALGLFISTGGGAPGTPPTITTSSPLPAGTVGSPYAQSIAATGSAPITFSVTAGALPTGLSLDGASGAITGTPTTAGTFNFTITATNAVNSDADPFSLTINPVGVDTTPDPFAFTDVTGVAISTLIVSNSVTITGINAPSPISVAGGEYSVGCSGTFTAVASDISNGQTVCVRHTSAGTPGTPTNTMLTVGGVSDTFTSITAGVPPQPPQSAAEIPTLSQWSLMLLALGLGVIATLRLRRPM